MSSDLMPLKTRCVDRPLHVKSVDAETSSRWCGGGVMSGGQDSFPQVSPSPLDHGSELRATRGLLATDLVILKLLTSHFEATQELLAMDLVILKLLTSHFEATQELLAMDLVILKLLTSHFEATQELLSMDLVILNHCQVTLTTPEMVPNSPNFHSNMKIFSLEIFNMYQSSPLHGGSSVASRFDNAGHEFVTMTP
ncbi:hypothetical protein TNCV_3030991 [Trichonephila clavipes]|nr:hypothetical protein TNCV_3030991 [Trichonephila clavipes]